MRQKRQLARQLFGQQLSEELGSGGTEVAVEWNEQIAAGDGLKPVEHRYELKPDLIGRERSTGNFRYLPFKDIAQVDFQ